MINFKRIPYMDLKTKTEIVKGDYDVLFNYLDNLVDMINEEFFEIEQKMDLTNGK
jgi:hypothetical protein